jgi:hydroxyacylglutathione hydrolase
VRVVPVPQLSDNYAYLVIDPAANDAAVVDCAEAGPVLAEAERQSVRLVAVLATHHHYDHVGGNEDLLRALPGLRVYGSADDAPRIPGITNPVRDGETVEVADLQARVLLIPAHTSGHVAYYFADHDAVFTGDTLGEVVADGVLGHVEVLGHVWWLHPGELKGACEPMP